MDQRKLGFFCLLVIMALQLDKLHYKLGVLNRVKVGIGPVLVIT